METQKNLLLMKNLNRLESSVAESARNLERKVKNEWHKLEKYRKVGIAKEEEISSCKYQIQQLHDNKNSLEKQLKSAESGKEALEKSHEELKKNVNRLRRENDKITKEYEKEKQMLKQKIEFYQNKWKERYDLRYSKRSAVRNYEKAKESLAELEEQLKSSKSNLRACQADIFKAKCERGKRNAEERGFYPLQSFIICISKIGLEFKRLESEEIQVMTEISFLQQNLTNMMNTQRNSPVKTIDGHERVGDNLMEEPCQNRTNNILIDETNGNFCQETDLEERCHHSKQEKTVWKPPVTEQYQIAHNSSKVKEITNQFAQIAQQGMVRNRLGRLKLYTPRFSPPRGIGSPSPSKATKLSSLRPTIRSAPMPTVINPFNSEQNVMKLTELREKNFMETSNSTIVSEVISPQTKLLTSTNTTCKIAPAKSDLQTKYIKDYDAAQKSFKSALANSFTKRNVIGRHNVQESNANATCQDAPMGIAMHNSEFNMTKANNISNKSGNLNTISNDIPTTIMYEDIQIESSEINNLVHDNQQQTKLVYESNIQKTSAIQSKKTYNEDTFVGTANMKSGRTEKYQQMQSDLENRDLPDVRFQNVKGFYQKAPSTPTDSVNQAQHKSSGKNSQEHITLMDIDNQERVNKRETNILHPICNSVDSLQKRMYVREEICNVPSVNVNMANLNLTSSHTRQHNTISNNTSQQIPENTNYVDHAKHESSENVYQKETFVRTPYMPNDVQSLPMDSVPMDTDSYKISRGPSIVLINKDIGKITEEKDQQATRSLLAYKNTELLSDITEDRSNTNIGGIIIQEDRNFYESVDTIENYRNSENMVPENDQQLQESMKIHEPDSNAGKTYSESQDETAVKINSQSLKKNEDEVNTELESNNIVRVFQNAPSMGNNEIPKYANEDNIRNEPLDVREDEMNQVSPKQAKLNQEMQEGKSELSQNSNSEKQINLSSAENNAKCSVPHKEISSPVPIYSYENKSNETSPYFQDKTIHTEFNQENTEFNRETDDGVLKSSLESQTQTRKRSASITSEEMEIKSSQFKSPECLLSSGSSNIKHAQTKPKSIISPMRELGNQEEPTQITVSNASLVSSKSIASSNEQYFSPKSLEEFSKEQSMTIPSTPSKLNAPGVLNDGKCPENVSPFDFEKHMKALGELKQSPQYIYQSRLMYNKESGAVTEIQTTSPTDASKDLPFSGMTFLNNVPAVDDINSTLLESDKSKSNEPEFLSFAYEDYLADSPESPEQAGKEKSMFSFGCDSPQTSVKSPPFFPLFAAADSQENDNDKGKSGFVLNFGGGGQAKSPDEPSGFKFSF